MSVCDSEVTVSVLKSSSWLNECNDDSEMTVVVELVCSILLRCFRLLQFTSQFGCWSLRLRRNNTALCEALDNLESSLNNTHKGTLLLHSVLPGLECVR